jgi:NNP family nitrate/nitrite transporter-like MFS transporter
VILSVVETLALAFVGTMIVSTGMGVNNAAVFKKVPEEVPEAVSGASGWIGGLGAFGGFLIPPASGSVVSAMGRIGYARAFVIYVVLAVIGLLVVYTMSRSDSGVNKTPADAVES